MGRYAVRKHGKMKSKNARVEISKLTLDDVYISLLKRQDKLKENTEDYQRIRVKIFVLSHLAQNDWVWFTVRELIDELLKASILSPEALGDGKWEAFIRMFLYRLYKKGFLERKVTIVGTLAYKYRVKTEKMKNQMVFFYESYSELIREEGEVW
ncbi:hypothetical protein [Thermococcus sp. 21S7]|uniref:hypothetical protein n=1 Tax=Thermococcus sp. 21S7 TaxID=1638221 RepID=UPI00143CBCA4|nr:hypothetical protein [Thermococcus sp. 21S7]NJE60553.1 hypothetical protein [Thermococcus sp. 21S7]